MQSWLVSRRSTPPPRASAGLGGVRLVTGAARRRSWPASAGRSCGPADGLVVAPGRRRRCSSRVGAGLWAERPFMVGLLVPRRSLLLAMEGRLDPRWLRPDRLGVGQHATARSRSASCCSWWPPSGAASTARTPAVELRVPALGRPGHAARRRRPARAAGARCSRSSCSQRQDVLQPRRSSGRRRPSTSTSQRLFIVQLVLAIVAARPPAVLPVGAARRRCSRRRPCSGARNLAVASLVLLPVMAPALDGHRLAVEPAPARAAARLAGRGRRWRRSSLLTVGPARPGRPRPATLPGRRARLPRASGRRHPGGPPGGAGLRRQPRRLRVRARASGSFYDDRFDMFPDDVTAAHLALLSAEPAHAGAASTTSTSTWSPLERGSPTRPGPRRSTRRGGRSTSTTQWVLPVPAGRRPRRHRSARC